MMTMKQFGMEFSVRRLEKISEHSLNYFSQRLLYTINIDIEAISCQILPYFSQEKKDVGDGQK